MKWLSVTLIAALVASVSACGEPFNYETASPEAREAWLEPKAKAYTDGFRRGLNIGFVKFNVDAPKINTRSREVIILARAETDGKGAFRGKARTKLNVKMCGMYVGSPLHRNDIRVTHKLRHKGGETILNLSLSPSSCASVIAKDNARKAREAERKRVS